MGDEFQQWVDRLVRERFGTNRALAEAIGLTNSGFRRGVRSGTLSTESLLRLADSTGRPASEVLRMAGKADVAALIERLYGPARDDSPAPATRELLEILAELPEAAPIAVDWLRALRAAWHSRSPGDTPHLAARAAGTNRRAAP